MASPRVPAYRLHKASGQAVVTIAGRDHYLGRHGSEASRKAYDALVGRATLNPPRSFSTAAFIVRPNECADEGLP